MFKKFLVLVAMLYAAASFAAVDVNKATAAELDGIKGIGPGISTQILDERKKGNFKDWNDFIGRVKGIGEGNAAKFSGEGLTVGGATYKGAPAAPSAAVAKKDEKPVAKADAKPVAAAPAPTPAAAAVHAAKVEKEDPQAVAKANKEAEKKAKAEEKQKKADEAKAKKEVAAQAKADANKAKDDAKK